MGYEVVDYLVERVAGLDADRAWSRRDRAALAPHLSGPAPEGPTGFETLLRQLRDDVLAFTARIDHPRFMAFVPGAGTWPGILADFLAAGHNVFQGTWLASSGPSAVELVVLDWFRTWLGCPEQAAGLLVSGGSAANLTALACARDSRLGGHDPDAVIYASDQVHSSALRAARILGFRPEQLRVLPADQAFRLPVAALEAAIAADRGAGRRPFLVIASAGTTSTGAVDPLPELRRLCDAQDLWLHVDAAYGGFAVLTERGRAALPGIGAADSITLDPHKWLYQPFEAGCLLVRDGAALVQTFHVMPDYLQDTAVGGREVNFADRGLQLTRAARALKIWTSIRHFGLDAFRRTIDGCIDLALHAEEVIRRTPSLELLAPAALGVVCFRRRGAPGQDEAEVEAANAALLRRILDSGLAMASSTRLRGIYALRLCILNFRTTEANVDRVLHWFAGAALEE